MPRVKRTDKHRVRFTPLEALWAKGDLAYGPERLNDDNTSSWPRAAHRRVMFETDEEALEGYLELVGGGYGFAGVMFGEQDWAFWRFERGLSAADAFARVREARESAGRRWSRVLDGDNAA